jgi:hypothetical protein
VGACCRSVASKRRSWQLARGGAHGHPPEGEPGESARRACLSAEQLRFVFAEHMDEVLPVALHPVSQSGREPAAVPASRQGIDVVPAEDHISRRIYPKGWRAMAVIVYDADLTVLPDGEGVSFAERRALPRKMSAGIAGSLGTAATGAAWCARDYGGWAHGGRV